MPGHLNFKIKVTITNPQVLPEITARMRDFRPVFENITKEWASLNEQKFGLARGKEMSGVDLDDIHWAALKPSTIKQKRAAGFPDALMHATGALEEAMTDPERFFHEATTTETAFGTPLSPEEEDKIKFNWRSRQVLFFGMADVNMIRRHFLQYLSLGGDYQELLFSKGMSNLNLAKEAANMDLEFNDRFPIDE